MEAIVAIVGFLGAGKTTLLKKVVKNYAKKKWNPFIILNDYENAQVDTQDFLSFLNPEQINALSGSCICCSGVQELRELVNNSKPREKGVTLIEANGTTDAVSLMGFLGVGVDKRFLPPVQIAVVDVRNWQKRGYNNELEANQVQVSSVIILNYTDQVNIERLVQVEQDIRNINLKATITHWDKFDISSIPELHPNIDPNAKKIDHHKTHWSSCSVDLPDPMTSDSLNEVLREIPSTILRVKGCTRLDNEEHYTHFERTPTGEVSMWAYHTTPITGPKLVTIGPGSNPSEISELISQKCK